MRRVQVNQDGLKLYGICELLVYVNNVNVLKGGAKTLTKMQKL
jgi:hypothetical protein